MEQLNRTPENLPKLNAYIYAKLQAVDTDNVARCAYLNGLATGACNSRDIARLLRGRAQYAAPSLAGYTVGVILRAGRDLGRACRSAWLLIFWRVFRYSPPTPAEVECLYEVYDVLSWTRQLNGAQILFTRYTGMALGKARAMTLDEEAYFLFEMEELHRAFDHPEGLDDPGSCELGND